jgi:hypothetical protein
MTKTEAAEILKKASDEAMKPEDFAKSWPDLYPYYKNYYDMYLHALVSTCESYIRNHPEWTEEERTYLRKNFFKNRRESKGLDLSYILENFSRSFFDTVRRMKQYIGFYIVVRDNEGKWINIDYTQFDKNTRSWISDNKSNILEVKDIENYLKKNGIEHELL